eukprot:662576-Heterocapsa_arctica.AAC.1
MDQSHPRPDRTGLYTCEPRSCGRGGKHSCLLCVALPAPRELRWVLRAWGAGPSGRARAIAIRCATKR